MKMENDAGATARVLPLTETAADVAIIQSVMYYPEDETSRRKYQHWHRMLENDPGLSERIDLGNSVDPKQVAERTRRATKAGAVLACYYLLDHLKYRGGVFEKPSLEKAMHAVEGFAHHADTFIDGSFIHAAARTLKECWKEFRSSAPFWAALWLNEKGSPYAFMEPDTQFDNATTVDAFLGVVKELRAFGTGAITIQRRPLLDDCNTWQLPDRIVQRDVPRMAQTNGRLIAIMRTYTPRKSEYVSALPDK